MEGAVYVPDGVVNARAEWCFPSYLELPDSLGNLTRCGLCLRCVFLQGFVLVCPMYDWADSTYMYIIYAACTMFHPSGLYYWKTSWCG